MVTQAAASASKSLSFLCFSPQSDPWKSVKKVQLSPLIAHHVDGNYTTHCKANYIIDVLSERPTKTNVIQPLLLGVSLAYFLQSCEESKDAWGELRFWSVSCGIHLTQPEFG